MTTYFDRMRTRLAKGEDCDYPEVEAEVVLAVTRVAEWPGLAPDFRRAIHQTILKHAIMERPPAARTHPTATTGRAEWYEVVCLVSELHDIFHGIGRTHGYPFSDGPEAVLVSLTDSGKQAREDLVANPEAPLKPPEAPTCVCDRMALRDMGIARRAAHPGYGPLVPGWSLICGTRDDGEYYARIGRCPLCGGSLDARPDPIPLPTL